MPAAWSPGCSQSHLPGYINDYDKLSAAGAEVIACVAVNDAFAVNAWGEHHGAKGKVLRPRLGTVAGGPRCWHAVRRASAHAGGHAGRPRRLAGQGHGRRPGGRQDHQDLRQLPRQAVRVGRALSAAQHARAACSNRECCRFSAVVEGGKFKTVNVEADGTGMSCSLASEALGQLK